MKTYESIYILNGTMTHGLCQMNNRPFNIKNKPRVYHKWDDLIMTKFTRNVTIKWVSVPISPMTGRLLR